MVLGWRWQWSEGGRRGQRILARFPLAGRYCSMGWIQIKPPRAFCKPFNQASEHGSIQGGVDGVLCWMGGRDLLDIYQDGMMVLMWRIDRWRAAAIIVGVFLNHGSDGGMWEERLMTSSTIRICHYFRSFVTRLRRLLSRNHLFSIASALNPYLGPHYLSSLAHIQDV